jgi:hypothetical protein
MSHAFCDDFDGRDAGWSAVRTSNGTAVPDDAEWVSPPQSLHTVVPAATALSAAVWVKNFAVAWHKTQVDMDLLLVSPDWDSGDPRADVILLEVAFEDDLSRSSGDSLVVAGSLYLSAGGLSASAGPGDGGYLMLPGIRVSDGWHHITLVADPTTPGASTVIRVDGTPFQSVPYKARASSSTPSILVLVGPAAYAATTIPTPLYDFYIDNVTVDFP